MKSMLKLKKWGTSAFLAILFVSSVSATTTEEKNKKTEEQKRKGAFVLKCTTLFVEATVLPIATLA